MHERQFKTLQYSQYLKFFKNGPSVVELHGMIFPQFVQSHNLFCKTVPHWGNSFGEEVRSDLFLRSCDEQLPQMSAIVRGVRDDISSHVKMRQNFLVVQSIEHHEHFYHISIMVSSIYKSWQLQKPQPVLIFQSLGGSKHLCGSLLDCFNCINVFCEIRKPHRNCCLYVTPYHGRV